MRTLLALISPWSAFLPAMLAIVGFPVRSSAETNDPKISFDLNYTVECQDVTPKSFAMRHPDGKVIEANLRVSVRMETGDEKDVEQLQFEIASPAGRLRMLDFLPRTQIQAEAADAIEIVKTSETIRSVGATMGSSVSIGGGGDQIHGVAFTSALPTGNANATRRNELKETTKKIPAGKAVIVSGTLANEHGLFFKFHRTATGTFEGIKPFSFRFLAPREWRGDWLVISCHASGTVKRCFLKSIEQIGVTKAFLALHLSGDAAAERAAAALAEAQEQCLAADPAEEGHEMIDAFARKARPTWSAADANPAEAENAGLTGPKPLSLGGVFKFAASFKSAPRNACDRLSQALDRIASFSGARHHLRRGATTANRSIPAGGGGRPRDTAAGPQGQ